MRSTILESMGPNICVKVGRRIRYLRTQRKVSQRTLAALSDISRINLSRIENGKAEAGIGTLYRIAQALGAKLTELLDGL